VQFDPGGGIDNGSIEALQELLDLIRKHPDADLALMFGPIDGPNPERVIRERIAAVRKALELRGRIIPAVYPKTVAPEWSNVRAGHVILLANP
jgi:hypothetical protein